MGRHEERYQMITRIFTAIFLFTSLAGFPQSINLSKVATVHVYREGRLLVETSLSADGNAVASLTPHQSVTFYLAPGYHELTMQSGEISPMASFRAEVGQQYWFRLNYEHVVSATSLREPSVSLTMQPNGPNEDDIRAVTMRQGKLLDILKKTSPRGFAIEDATEPGATSNPAE
jgi:hypothetical protein